MATWAPSTETDIHAIRLNPMEPDDPKRQWLEPGDTEEDVKSLKFEIDFEDFTLSLIGANMENHSFFYRNAPWECVPDGGCPGMTVGGYALWHSSEGPSERKIETFEARAVSTVDEGEFFEWIAGLWYENNNHRRAGRSWWDTNDVDYIASLRGGWRSFRGCDAVTPQQIASGAIIGNYEAGVRSTWQDGRLLLTGSVYRIDWADMRSPLFRATAEQRIGLSRISGRVLVNVGKSRISGPFEASVDVAGEMSIREFERVPADFDADQATGNVVGRRVNATPDARQAALVRGVAIGRPLQLHVHGRPVLEHQEFVRLDLEVAHAAREVGVAGQRRQNFGGRPRVGRVT